MTTPFFYQPVSAALEAEVRAEVRRNGVVVWLDQAAHYTGFVDRLMELRKAGELAYDVRAFRGSHLELMLALDGLAAGTEKVPLLVHMPGFSEDSIQQTPMLELYEAGVRYRRALDTLVTNTAAGQVRAEEIAAFKERAAFTLDDADAWLHARLRDAATGGSAALLRAMTPVSVLNDLLSPSALATDAAQPDTAVALWDRLTTALGLPEPWRRATLPPAPHRAADIAFAAASWALCVEYVDDLKRKPVNEHLQNVRNLPRPVIDACRELAAHLRDRHTEFYRRTADETEALLADEVEAADAADLGKIDTFRFEEDKVLKAALVALEQPDYEAAAIWAEQRVDDGAMPRSFWLRGDPTRQSAWQLVADAADLGRAITKAGARLGVRPAEHNPLVAAITAYAERGAAVDQAHRRLEQRRLALLYPTLPEFETLRLRLDTMRQTWRTWADAWARDFNALCRTHGFVPDEHHQQRSIFDEVVRPFTQEPGPTAYFVVDALRYEMAEELFRQLNGTPVTTVRLQPRLAELPTITDVGMNVLAPVHNLGRLSPVMAADQSGFRGFQCGEFRVLDPETRRRAMHDRVGGSTCPWLSLEEVVSRDSTSLRRAVSQARLVVVHSQEIDNAGEQGSGPAVFDIVMQKLRAAWRLLRDAGVRRFVFTSDHGFLLLDDSAGTAQTHGRRIDPKRRHVFSPVAADHSGEVRVALSDLGYEGVSGHVMFPESTAVFDTGRRPMSFVHGGNSLQERVIPVLTVVHRAASGANSIQYGVTARACDPVGGMHCLEARVNVVAQVALDFGSSREVELALRVPESEGGSAIHVEVCQTRGKARIQGGLVVATVGESFELFFRLSGTTDARVPIEVFHPSASFDVEPCTPATRFSVTATRSAEPTASPRLEAPRTAEWLDQFTDPGVRQFFAHLAAHGTITESEAGTMLGGPRGLRRFSLQFDELVLKAPFGVRIEVVGGAKVYIREGHA